MADVVQNARKAIAERIVQLEDELQRLRAAHDALGDGSPTPRANGRSRSRRTAERTTTRGRAPRGQNRTKILKEIEKRPGASSGEIINATGIKRNVAYTAISTLKKEGLVKADKDGGLTLSRRGLLESTT